MRRRRAEGVVEAKGKPGGVPCRPLLGAAWEPELRTRPNFVGREGELARLREAFTRVSAGVGPARIAIVGEAGIGKSAFVGEFRDWLSGQSPPPAERFGRCLSFGQASAYAPLGEIVREHGELLERRPILGLMLGQPAPEGLHPPPRELVVSSAPALPVYSASAVAEQAQAGAVRSAILQ